jgi:serpin B
MHLKSDLPYAQLDGLRILELPYEGASLSMLVLLPDARDGLGELEDRLTAENLRTWREALRPGEVDVRLPRFEMRSKFGLRQTLAGMGMPSAFSDGADFSGITPGTSLAIDDVIHEAYVKVNEEGTEAAAATGVVMKLTSVMERLFHADHPFLFLIWDGATESVLFLGRMADPTA